MTRITKAELLKRITELEAQLNILLKENGELKGRLKFFDDTCQNINNGCFEAGKLLVGFFMGNKK